jgi:hypothetical protein
MGIIPLVLNKTANLFAKNQQKMLKLVIRTLNPVTYIIVCAQN